MNGHTYRHISFSCLFFVPSKTLSLIRPLCLLIVQWHQLAERYGAASPPHHRPAVRHHHHNGPVQPTHVPAGQPLSLQVTVTFRVVMCWSLFLRCAAWLITESPRSKCFQLKNDMDIYSVLCGQVFCKCTCKLLFFCFRPDDTFSLRSHFFFFAELT